MNPQDKLTEAIELWTIMKQDKKMVRLQQLLAGTSRGQNLKASQVERSLTSEICSFLNYLETPPLALPDLCSEHLNPSTAISIHDIVGNFIWASPNSSALFELPQSNLLQGKHLNLFNLMDDESIENLILSNSSELFKSRKPISIRYSLISGKNLVSKVTEVILSASFNSRYGIMLQTRQSRGNKRASTNHLLKQNYYLNRTSKLDQLVKPSPECSMVAFSVKQPTEENDFPIDSSFRLTSHISIESDFFH